MDIMVYDAIDKMKRNKEEANHFFINVLEQNGLRGGSENWSVKIYYWLQKGDQVK